MFDRGKLVAGDQELKPQTEYIVFERNLNKMKSPWLIAGTLQPSTIDIGASK